MYACFVPQNSGEIKVSARLKREEENVALKRYFLEYNRRVIAYKNQQ